MALNIGESHALATLLHALGVGIGGQPPRPLREGQLLVALGTLTASAGKTLRLGWDPDDLRALDTRLTAGGRDEAFDAAVEWLINSRYVSDLDVQAAFWCLSQGLCTEDEADAGYMDDGRSLASVRETANFRRPA